MHHPFAVQVLSLAGELLGSAEGLLREGLHTAEIADGYQKALDKVRLYFSAAAHCRRHTVSKAVQELPTRLLAL